MKKRERQALLAADQAIPASSARPLHFPVAIRAEPANTQGARPAPTVP